MLSLPLTTKIMLHRAAKVLNRVSHTWQATPLVARKYALDKKSPGYRQVYTIGKDPRFEDAKGLMEGDANILYWNYKEGDCVEAGTIVGDVEVAIGVDAYIHNARAEVHGKFRPLKPPHYRDINIRTPLFMIEPVTEESCECKQTGKKCK
jgi:hypothetical protein